jgi:hypothetical protein
MSYLGTAWSSIHLTPVHHKKVDTESHQVIRWCHWSSGEHRPKEFPAELQTDLHALCHCGCRKRRRLCISGAGTTNSAQLPDLPGTKVSWQEGTIHGKSPGHVQSHLALAGCAPDCPSADIPLLQPHSRFCSSSSCRRHASATPSLTKQF